MKDDLSKDIHGLLRQTQHEFSMLAIKRLTRFDDLLIMKLVSFIVRRDHKVHNDGYQKGLERGKQEANASK